MGDEMIVSSSLSLRRLVIEVWRPLALFFFWDVAVTLLFVRTRFEVPALPMSVFGSGLVLFLGFRVNAAYARWWEARTL
jgi:putative membrane protein